MRSCIGPRSRGCPHGSLVRTATPRCPECASVFEQGRGSTTTRGYGKPHQDKRADYQARMNAGETFGCWRCTRTIDPRAWHLGHCDDDHTRYHGPECVSCNTAVSAHRERCPHPSHN